MVLFYHNFLLRETIDIIWTNYLAGWSSGGSGFCFLQQGEHPLLSFIASPVWEFEFEFEMQINVQQMIQMLELIWAQMNAAASSLRRTSGRSLLSSSTWRTPRFGSTVLACHSAMGPVTSAWGGTAHPIIYWKISGCVLAVWHASDLRDRFVIQILHVLYLRKHHGA